MENTKDKVVWKKAYTWVLILNAIYIVFFYLLMVLNK